MVVFLLAFLLVIMMVFLVVFLVVELLVDLVSRESSPEGESVAHRDEAELPEVGVSELRQHVVGNVLFIKGGHQVLVVEEGEEWISWGAVHSAEQDTTGEKYC